MARLRDLRTGPSPRARSPYGAGRGLGIGLLLLAALPFFAWPWFEARVAARFERAERAAPTRVYARPVALRPGVRLRDAQLRAYLEAGGYRRARAASPRSLTPGEFLVRGREWWIYRRPTRLTGTGESGGLLRVPLDRRGRIRSLTDASGRGLERALLEPPVLATFTGSAGRDRMPVRLAEAPEPLVKAVIGIEDRRFARHGGLDLRRIAGAFVANLRAGRVTQGGSTLTQQLARTLFLSRERSLVRKLKEAAVAVALERRFSKQRILEAYLNHIYLGHADGVAMHGVGRAARHYFGVDVSQLDVAQSALLAGLIRAPNLYAPARDSAAAKGRRDFVLREMARSGALGEEELARALERPLPPRPAPAAPRFAPYYVEHLREALQRLREDSDLGSAAPDLGSAAPDLGSAAPDLGSAGLTVVGTLRPALQAAAQRAVREGLARLERQYPHLRRRHGPLQAALVALEPASGEILALVGGRDYAASQFDRATDARRQPGSVFKPIVALSALSVRDGKRYTLASLLEDEPLTVRTPQGVWRPANYDGGFVGEITLRQALEESRNVPFARLGLEVGPERIAATARALGIASELRAVPSLALGASEVTLLEITSAYGVLAAGGRRAKPRPFRIVLDPEGRRVGPEPGEAVHAFEPAEAYLLTSTLRGVVERGTGRSVRSFGYYGPVAAKSGTTNGYRDAWFVGYTPEITVGVWVGFDDGTSVGRPGAAAALPIFAGFLRAALGPEGGAEFRMPPGVEVAYVDPWGGRYGWGCHPEREVFLAGTAPRNACAWPVIARARRALYDPVLTPGVWSERAARALADAQRRIREWLTARLERPVAVGGGRP